MPAPYPMDFRREAVALLKSSGKTVPQLAAELGVSPQSLRNWSRQIDVDDGRANGLTSDERDELRRLRRELRTVTEEREILKKAAAFFAKEAVAQSRPTALEQKGHLAWGILRPSNERLKQITGRETALGEAGGVCATASGGSGSPVARSGPRFLPREGP